MSVLSRIARMRQSLSRRSELLLLVPLALSGVTFAYFAFQPEPPNPAVQAAMDAQFINAAERQAIDAFRRIINENRAGTLSDADAAQRIEIEVLPMWKSARATHRRRTRRIGCKFLSARARRILSPSTGIVGSARHRCEERRSDRDGNPTRQVAGGRRDHSEAPRPHGHLQVSPASVPNRCPPILSREIHVTRGGRLHELRLA